MAKTQKKTEEPIKVYWHQNSGPASIRAGYWIWVDNIYRNAINEWLDVLGFQLGEMKKPQMIGGKPVSELTGWYEIIKKEVKDA